MLKNWRRIKARFDCLFTSSNRRRRRGPLQNIPFLLQILACTPFLSLSLFWLCLCCKTTHTHRLCVLGHLSLFVECGVQRLFFIFYLCRARQIKVSCVFRGNRCWVADLTEDWTEPQKSSLISNKREGKKLREPDHHHQSPTLWIGKEYSWGSPSFLFYCRRGRNRKGYRVVWIFLNFYKFCYEFPRIKRFSFSFYSLSLTSFSIHPVFWLLPQLKIDLSQTRQRCGRLFAVFAAAAAARLMCLHLFLHDRIRIGFSPSLSHFIFGSFSSLKLEPPIGDLNFRVASLFHFLSFFDLQFCF